MSINGNHVHDLLAVRLGQACAGDLNQLGELFDLLSREGEVGVQLSDVAPSAVMVLGKMCKGCAG